MPVRSLLTVRVPRRRRTDRERELVELDLQFGRRRSRAAPQTQLTTAAATRPGYKRPPGHDIVATSGWSSVSLQM